MARTSALDCLDSTRKQIEEVSCLSPRQRRVLAKVIVGYRQRQLVTLWLPWRRLISLTTYRNQLELELAAAERLANGGQQATICIASL